MARLLILCTVCCVPLTAAAQGSDSLGVESVHPGGHELFFMPTAYTMPKGNTYFEDYELFFLNITTAITNTTHIGAFTVFPITTDVLQSVALGVKQNVYSSESFGAAVFGSYTPKASFGSLGGVVSIGSDASSGHIGYTAIVGADDASGNVLMAGYAQRVSSVTKLIVEYENSITAFSDFSGILTFGARFAGKRIAWDIAAVRPLASTGSLLFLPYLKVILIL